MNSSENIFSLTGFGKVFKFTLTQTFKNKGYRISFIVFVLIMSAMGPINYLSSMAGTKAAESGFNFSFENSGMDKLYIMNASDISAEKTVYEDALKEEGLEAPYPIEMLEGRDVNGAISKLSEKDALIYINKENDGYHVNGIISDESEISSHDLDSLTSIMNDAFEEAKIKQTGISQAETLKLMKGVNSGEIMSEKDYIANKEHDVVGNNYISYLLGFTIIIMIVSSLSVSYIISSVTEEKQSKLVETLLVSVRPMALLVGKVVGMMTYAVLLLAGGLLGSRLADFIMRDVLALDMSNYTGSGINFTLFIENGLKGFIILFIALILAYLFFGFLSGVFGSAVSKTEDVQSATGSVMMITMAGYFGTFILGMSDKPVINHILAMVPPFSFFASPILYITGRVQFWELLVGFVIEAVLIIALVMLAARTYRTLILNDSSKPSLKSIISAGRY